ncbi:hybrid sensor histidine kinase/response regulator [Mastigocoleus sp. MO_188.B34]|uniref:hybrid sensor histidine kinase/response regulator n=1 Tax=Mastigocoleus sp. MO_188.B34 TaxID=3036635 RepID=UPI002635D9D1|nr:hybrid sensor histidine kinase/response regulator [Mastigocoleus sp. MO_188.B34]MDJ0694462.1 hybrid sensor histidine kinase/response regulator [Mastigocoleus sp. MO_188.B34]
MTTDSSIREQGYIYFLSEAPELLQTIEEELSDLIEDRSKAKVHKLMRATHTLKGGAANVGLEAINKISHSLEDVFKALYNPEVDIDNELYNLLFQSFECLQLALNAEITGRPIDHDELLGRAATIFAHLQEKLGDAFGAETHIPTSEELGFDIVLSIFETGVTQRIESITEHLKNPPLPAEFAEFLCAEAEVFHGLSESLNLPGFGEIAQATITALETNPDKALKIGEVVLSDLQKAKAAILDGDRTRGGEASPALISFTQEALIDEQPTTPDIPNPGTDLELSIPSGENIGLPTPKISLSSLSLREQIEELYEFLTQSIDINQKKLKPKKAKFYLKVIRCILGWFNHELDIASQDLSLSLLIPNHNSESSVKSLENWLDQFIIFLQAEEKESDSLKVYRYGIILTVLLTVIRFKYYQEESDFYLPVINDIQNKISQLAREYKNLPPVNEQEKNWLTSPHIQKLLKIKEATPQPEIPTLEDNIVEAIWGEDLTSIENEPVKIGEPELIISAEDLNGYSKEIISSNSEPVKIVSQTVAETQEAVIEPVLETKNQKVKIKNQSPTESPRAKHSRSQSSVRVNVEGLQRLNYLAGELLIHQKQRALQDTQLKQIIEQLVKQNQRHQLTLEQLRELPLYKQVTSQQVQNFASVDFDSLEMDKYTEYYLKLNSALEETLQLQETTESLDLLLSQSTHIHEKKQRLTLSIIDNLVEARMVPLGNILNRFPQMVRNLENLSDKQVELKLVGTRVLVDKAIAEKLYDPLLHIVRNAFDHGIEDLEVRRQNGKIETGSIEICAYHQGSQTIIEVKDDGQGLNLNKIRNKAVEFGLLTPEAEFGAYSSAPTEEEILDCLFAPGFSTAGKVSEISGRGIGLDIVRSQLHSLNGSVTVSSIPHQGTTFTLKIPFSMTTDKLMIVQVDNNLYALLLDCIEKILIPTPEQIKEFEGKKALYWKTDNDEQMISLRKLSDFMGYNCPLFNVDTAEHKVLSEHAANMKSPVLLLRREKQMLGLEVDQIIGEQELVIRPLGSTITPPKYVYGCSSLASGNLILVIDGTLLPEHDQMLATLDTTFLPSVNNHRALGMGSDNNQTTALLNPSKNSISHNQISSRVVLIVDDAISLRQTLSLTLQKYGYQVIQAQNGVEALEQLQKNPNIQLVVSDLEMPRMNGFELLSNIRQSPEFIKIPVIILSSRSGDKHRQLAQNLGATAYLTKPYLEHEFIAKADELINYSSKESSQLLSTK